MNLDPTLKSEILCRLNSPYGRIALRVDERDVTVQVERISKTQMVYGPVVYVDGRICGEWFTEPPEFIRKVWRKRTVSLYTRSEKRHLQRVKFKGLNLEAKSEYWVPDFPSSAAFVRGLERNCSAVALREE